MKSSRKKQDHRRKKQNAAQILSKRIKRRFPDQKLVMGGAPDGVKMSDVLEAFVEPYRELVDTKDAFYKLLTIAIVAWNAALLPAQKRMTHVENILQVLPESARSDGIEIVKELIERKERYFSENKRMILDCEVEETEKGYHLFVISTL